MDSYNKNVYLVSLPHNLLSCCHCNFEAIIPFTFHCTWRSLYVGDDLMHVNDVSIRGQHHTYKRTCEWSTNLCTFMQQILYCIFRTLCIVQNSSLVSLQITRGRHLRDLGLIWCCCIQTVTMNLVPRDWTRPLCCGCFSRVLSHPRLTAAQLPPQDREPTLIHHYH